jgi:hypothetical protein
VVDDASASRDQAGRGAAVALQIVLGTYALDGPGGTESYSLTVAHELRRLGHGVTLTAERLGPVAEIAEREGLVVARRPDDLPEGCDAAIVHDAVMTGAIAKRFPGARIVHVAHSDLFDHQLPVLVQGVVDAVVVLSDRVESRVRALALDVPVVRLRQPVDQQRFAPAGPLALRPRRALLLGNYLEGERRAALVDAWAAAGIECVQVGLPEQLQLDVRPAIAAADIVVAKGRAALEAMSCARAVYVYDAFGGDGWVTPARYPALEADGFAGQATPAPRGPAELAADLAGYQASMGWLNHELVRTHHAARRHAAALVALLRDGPAVGREVTMLDEVSRLSRLMFQAQGQVSHGEVRVVTATQEAERWRSRALAAEAEAERARALLTTRRVRAGLALGRAVDLVRGKQ